MFTDCDGNDITDRIKPGVDLTGASLCYLAGANPTGANLIDVDLVGADLVDVKGWVTVKDNEDIYGLDTAICVPN